MIDGKIIEKFTFLAIQEQYVHLGAKIKKQFLKEVAAWKNYKSNEAQIIIDTCDLVDKRLTKEVYNAA